MQSVILHRQKNANLGLRALFTHEAFAILPPLTLSLPHSLTLFLILSLRIHRVPSLVSTTLPSSPPRFIS